MPEVMAGMLDIIIGIPPHIIIIGMPCDIILDIMSQRCVIISIICASIGIILTIMPSLVISQLILHIMGAIMFMEPFIMFIGIGIMFMPFIMGIPFIIGMPFIIGIPIIMGMVFIGIAFIMGMPFIMFIGIGIGIMFIAFIIGFPPSVAKAADGAGLTADPTFFSSKSFA
jgi:hypothetical protein